MASFAAISSDVEFLLQAEQFGAADAEQAGRFFMMAVGLFERSPRVLTGSLFSRLKRLIRPVHRFRKRLAQPIRKIRSHDDGALRVAVGKCGNYRVFQPAHGAGP